MQARLANTGHSRVKGDFILAQTFPAWIDRGVLVYGPRKAGTTLFQNLLDGSPALFAYPAELKLKYFARHPGKADDIETYFAKSRVTTARSANFDPAPYEAAWQQALKERSLKGLGDFIRFDAFAVRQGVSGMGEEPQLWCAKEVGGPADAILGLWRRHFPKGKALFIMREPLMVTRAVLNDRRRKERKLSLREIIRETLDPMRVVAAQAKHLGDPDVHIVSYEHLVADTEAVMRGIAAFLGIPYDDILTRPSIFGEVQVVRTSSRKTAEVFAPAQSWTDGLEPREIRIVSRVSAMAGKLGRYRVDYPAILEKLKSR